MNESIEKPKVYFLYPDLEAERGEFERVAETFSIDDSVLMFQAQSGELVDLDDAIWRQLDNTDSNRFDVGDWDTAVRFATEANRDYLDLKDKLERNVKLDAPIIMQHNTKYHLVSGNTRLMVSKALGITPKVLLFEVDM